MKNFVIAGSLILVILICGCKKENKSNEFSNISSAKQEQISSANEK